MQIGLVMLVWAILLLTVVFIYLFLRFLAKNFYIFDVIKDGFIAIIGVFIISFASLICINIFDFVMQNLYPTKIFTDNFNFSPTSDVEIIEGSNKIFAERSLGRISLKFKAKDETIEKIIKNRKFYEEERQNLTENADIFLRENARNENMIFYHSTDFATDCDPDNGNCHAYLVLNKQNGEAYFSW